MLINAEILKSKKGQCILSPLKCLSKNIRSKKYMRPYSHTHKQNYKPNMVRFKKSVNLCIGYTRLLYKLLQLFGKFEIISK